MKATVPNLRAARASVGQVAVGQVAVGPISIGQLVLRDTKMAINSGQALIQGMRMTIKLKFVLSWRVQIPLPWPFDDIDPAPTSIASCSPASRPARTSGRSRCAT